MAKYMLIMRASDETLAAMGDASFEQMLETVGRYNEELVQAFRDYETGRLGSITRTARTS